MDEKRDFQVGDKVQHVDFGEGLVLETKGSGDHAALLISFDDKVKRKLVVRFAKLTLLAPAQTKEAPRPRPRAR